MVLLLAACGQDESYFHDPTPNNLGKDPYDFAAPKYPRDLSALVLDDLGNDVDMAASVDMTVPPGHDLRNLENADLTMQ
jgi:hypothetical protein